MKTAAISVLVVYNILSTIVSFIIARMKLTFQSIRIHSFTNLKEETKAKSESTEDFLLDFACQMDNCPLIPFVSIRFSQLRLLSVDGGTLCSVKLSQSLPLNSRTVIVNNAECHLGQDHSSRLLFDEFSLSLLQDRHVTFQMVGYVNLYLFNLIPILPFSYIRLQKTCTVPALNKLKQFEITSVDVRHGSSEVLMLHCQLNIYNDSIISLQTDSNVQLDMFYTDMQTGREYVGYTVIEDFNLNLGRTELQGQVFMVRGRSTPEVMSKFVVSDPLYLTATGTDSSTEIECMRYAVSRLSLDCRMPGLDTELISTAYLSLLSTNPLTLTTSSSLDVYNPFEVEVKIFGVQGTVKLSREVIGVIDYQEEPGIDDGISMAPKSISHTKDLSLQLKVNLVSLNALVQMAVNQQLKVDVECVLRTFIGDFETNLSYRQNYVNVVIN
jgi:hypothetical protein